MGPMRDGSKEATQSSAATKSLPVVRLKQEAAHLQPSFPPSSANRRVPGTALPKHSNCLTDKLLEL